jgi:Hemerythrin HHE cation binding domain
MPVTIGAKTSPDFSNPIDLLIDCHRRIERFLTVLVKVAEQAKGGLMTKEQSRECEQALDYFRNAAPRHTADEEESLFPRLRVVHHLMLNMYSPKRRNSKLIMSKRRNGTGFWTNWAERGLLNLCSRQVISNALTRP